MKIALNARVLATQEIRGWSRYTVNLLEGLLNSNHEVFLFSDQPINQKLIPLGKSFCQLTVKAGKNYIDWEQRILAQLCREHQIDVLHCPINYGLPLLSNTKKVLTLHDAIEKAFYDQFKSTKDFLNFNHLKVRALHYASQKAADKIITVSHHAKQDIVKEYGVSPDKIEVIYEGADRDFSTNNVISKEELKKHFSQIQYPYFFYVGGLEKRKNIHFLINAWEEAKLDGYHLVIGGGKSEEISALQKIAVAKGLNIYFLGYVSQELLPSLYAHAQAFIYPSLYEGFGLQLVESMKMGTPVLCSNVTSLPEILADESCTFNPMDTRELAQKIQLMTLEKFQKEKSQRVLIRSQDFSWDRAIKKTIQVYEDLADI